MKRVIPSQALSSKADISSRIIAESLNSRIFDKHSRPIAANDCQLSVIVLSRKGRQQAMKTAVAAAIKNPSSSPLNFAVETAYLSLREHIVSLLYDFLRPVCCETYKITGDPRSPLRKADLSVLFIFHKPYYRQNTKYH